jgi:hypothetical protein
MHARHDPKTKVLRKQRRKHKLQGVVNSELAKKRREEKEQKAQNEQREQERRAPEIEPVVGNEIQNKVLETVP